MDAYWTITSPTGETFKARTDQVTLDRQVETIADCNDQSAPMERVYGPLTITAVVEDQ